MGHREGHDLCSANVDGRLLCAAHGRVVVNERNSPVVCSVTANVAHKAIFGT